MRRRISKVFVFLLIAAMTVGNCSVSVAADAFFLDHDGDGFYDNVLYGEFGEDPTPIPDPDPDPDPPIPDPRVKLPTPNATFDAGTMTLRNLDDTMSYSYDSGNNWYPVPKGAIIIPVTDDQAEYALAHGISIIRFAKSAEFIDSDAQIIEVHKIPTPDGVKGVNPTSGNNGQLLNVAPGMQYHQRNSSQWIDIGSNVVGGLAAGTYLVRVKGSGIAISSDEVSIVLEKTPTPTPTPPKQKEPTPSADFNAMNATLTGTLYNSYSIDGGNSWTYVGNSNSVILDMNRLSTSKGILLFKPGNGVTTSDSDRQTINLKKAGIPTGIGAISATSTAPGMITGVSNSMEYMKQGASSWTSITGNTISVAPGNYCVRVGGAYTTLPSDPVAVIITQSITSTPVTVKTTPSTAAATSSATAFSGKKLVIMQVQTALNALGYKTGTPDGVLGKQTKAAIRKYQKVNGLKVTGTVNTQLVKSLNIK